MSMPATPPASRGNAHMTFAVTPEFIAEHDRRHEAALAEDYAAIGRQLQRRGIDIEKMTARAASFAVAVPTWCGHGRHALRTLSWARRAAQHLRQARGLQRDPRADARDARRLAAVPMG